VDSKTLPVWIGWDPSELRAVVVATHSARATSGGVLDLRRLALSELQARGLYRRETTMKAGSLWDVISGAPMTTGHAIGRFFVPFLAGYTGWAVFMDGDVLVRSDLRTLFALADPQYAVQVVQHAAGAQGGFLKKDKQIQTVYPRKNWSSVMLFNCAHPAHTRLTLDHLNMLPGRDLHRFCWLEDSEIGELPAGWNYLVGVSPSLPAADVHLAHFTLGIPEQPEGMRFALEWWERAKQVGYSPRSTIVQQIVENRPEAP
jgi:hypothetical protein